MWRRDGEKPHHERVEFTAGAVQRRIQARRDALCNFEGERVDFGAMLGRECRGLLVKPLKLRATDAVKPFLKGLSDWAHALAKSQARCQ